MKVYIDRALRIAGSAGVGYILLQIIWDFYQAAPKSGTWPGGLTPQWAIGLIGLAGFCGIVFALVLLALWFPARAAQFGKVFVQLRQRLGWLRWPIAIAIVIFPAFLLLYTNWGREFTDPYLNLLLLLVASFLVAICTTQSDEALILRLNALFGLVFTASIYIIGAHLTNVTQHPFSLSWSEGNRFYDYSVYADPGRYIYPGKLTIPYDAPGRYWLWGILFLVPDSPIWMHRLWNAVLWTIPYILLGFSMARWSKLSAMGRWSFVLWIFLFLSQGPVYPTLILSALLVVLFVHPERPLVSLIGAAIAGYYASSSRWTWLPAPATWAGFILLSEYQLNRGEKWSKALWRLIPIGAVAVAGLVGGMLANSTLLSPKQLQTGSTTFSQPLLWYRLFPNATYKDGILLALVAATVPLILLLFWLAITKRWSLNWLQKTAYIGACLIFLVIGLIASVKIGGGNNLHNMDMFLASLAILAGLSLRAQVNLNPQNWPKLAQAMLILAVFLPAWNAIKIGAPLELPPQAEVEKALDTISTRVIKAQQTGEVLFVDERQLLTFGYIEGIPLVAEYEKKYMMDQAMAGDADYFEQFYRDLASKRFSLIITETLFTVIKDEENSFGEENNAWVQWVAKPLLCYYEPAKTIPSVKVQLLVPRSEPTDCP